MPAWTAYVYVVQASAAKITDACVHVSRYVCTRAIQIPDATAFVFALAEFKALSKSLVYCFGLRLLLA